MNMKRITGSLAAGVIAVGLASVPMTAEAAPASTTVSAAHVSAAANGVADRKKKKKPKVSVSVARNPAGCYDIALRVTKKRVPIAGALVRIQSKARGHWRNTSDAPFRTDANGGASFTNAGLHSASGAASSHPIRFKYKKNYSRGFRAPCAS